MLVTMNDLIVGELYELWVAGQESNRRYHAWRYRNPFIGYMDYNKIDTTDNRVHINDMLLCKEGMPTVLYLEYLPQERNIFYKVLNKNKIIYLSFNRLYDLTSLFLPIESR